RRDRLQARACPRPGADPGGPGGGGRVARHRGAGAASGYVPTLGARLRAPAPGQHLYRGQRLQPPGFAGSAGRAPGRRLPRGLARRAAAPGRAAVSGAAAAERRSAAVGHLRGPLHPH
ncbi:hypothetical protein OY671_011033, partial [Metschnikowia pulcherrima]